MTKYKLFQLGLDEELISESSSLGDTILKAVSLSEVQKESDRYDTFRLETWIDYERKHGNRYFEKGEEITERIIRETLGHIVSLTS
jgi:hypothetical protein